MKRILLVDDDRNTAYVLSMMLKLNEFEVHPFTDPEAALANFQRGQFDLLLLDVRMPAISGFDLYRKLKSIDENAKVCFMTNNAEEYQQEFRESFPELGRINFSAKPAVADELLKMIWGVLGAE